MQVNLAARRIRASILFSGRASRLFPCLPGISLVKFLTISLLLVACLISQLSYGAESAQPGFQKLFHLVGIPGLRRDERVNLTLSPDGLSFETKKVQYQVPYARIRQVLLLHSDRRYEGRVYAAALASYGIGSLLILKKHHVDTAVLDYVNERGGKMGIVLQMEVSQGQAFGNLLQSRGVPVEEPGAPSQPLTKQQAETDTKDKLNP